MKKKFVSRMLNSLSEQHCGQGCSRYGKKNRQRGGQAGRQALCLTLSAAAALGLVGCGQEEAEQAAITDEEQEQVLNGVLHAQISPSHSSGAGKEETVYVLADADGNVNQVIVSDWLKNSGGGHILADSSDLTDIQNVKGYESFETDQDGNITWQAEGSDIYYRGTTDKELPVKVKVSYQLDGKDISASELAGKSGRVTIRMDYENKETKTVEIGGREEEIKVPFAMISGMILPQDTFSNIEVTNARLLSEGNNSVVVGLAFPGLKESIDVEGLKDKLEDTEENEELKDLEIPDYIEVSADTDSFELGMTMTVAMSDVLSDIELTDSLDLSDINDSMDELRDATDQLKDGTTELKDGSGRLKEGTEELAAGTDELWDGAVELKDGSTQLRDGAAQLKDGTQELYEKSGLLNNGASALYDGTEALQDGAHRLKEGTEELKDGGSKLAAGTGSLAAGVENLNNGALLVQQGVNQMAAQVAAQMGMLQAKIGTPVESSADFDANNPSTLLQLSCLLNESLKGASSRDGLSDAYYSGILANLQQQKAQAQENLNNSSANLSAAQERASAALAEMTAACQGSTQEIEAVTGTHEEESYVDVTVEVPVYTTTRTVIEGTEDGESGETEEGEENGAGSTVTESTDVQTQSVTGTGVVTREVVDTDIIQVQSVDVENLQQKVNDYQSAMEEAAVYQADVDAYSKQIAMLDEEISAADAAMAEQASQQEALAQKWGPAITYAAYMDNYLKELSAALNSQGSAEGMAALVKGAGDLANGTQSALAGAKELDSGANELKKGINSLSSGAGELENGAGTLKEGAKELAGGTGQLIDGTAKLNDGAGTLSDGIVTLDDGIVTLKDGAGALKDGAVTLNDGMGTLDAGALELLDGMFEFDEEGISRLTDLFGDDVQDVVDRLKAVADAGKEYNTFTRLPENVDGSVKFIIKTEAVEQQ